MNIFKIFISSLLILCFHLVECLEGNFVNEAKWDWKYSCINHPFAVAPGTHSIEASFKVDSCELKFDYPDGLSDNTEEERNAFCKAMFPNHVTSAKKDDGFPITCKYLRNRKCNANSTIVIGDNCVSICKNAVDFKTAKDLCKLQDGASLIDKDNHQVISFLSRLYIWNKPEAATWALGEGDKPYHLSLGYSAIGNNVPGTSEIVNDPAKLNTTATVVCVGMANNLQQGSAPIPYCEMISEFLKIPSENFAETCYYATQSVISARHHTADKRLATVDHFNQICRTKHSQLNYAVAPTSTQHKDQLTKFVNGRSKRDLLLPGSLYQHWDDGRKTWDKDAMSSKQLSSSLFSFKTVARINGEVLYDQTLVDYDSSWKTDYPVEETRKTILAWSDDGKIQNVDSFRRSPILCATGPVVPITKLACKEGWEVAHRQNHSICFKAINAGCGPVSAYAGKCESYGALLAPMRVEEEKTAIVRAVRRLHGMTFHGSVVLGGDRPNKIDHHRDERKKPYLTEYTWFWDKTMVDPIYWVKKEPSQRTVCNVFQRNCWSEACVVLRLIRGQVNGLMDAWCQSICESESFEGTYTAICAKNATWKQF